MILVIAIGISIVCTIVGHLFEEYYMGDGDPEYLFKTCGGLGMAVSIILLIAIALINMAAPGKVASMREEYKTLKFKLESPSSRDEFGLVNKDIIEDVGSWNSMISKKKALQDDFWIGIFIPNIYDEFEIIEMNID